MTDDKHNKHIGVSEQLNSSDGDGDGRSVAQTGLQLQKQRQRHARDRGFTEDQEGSDASKEKAR